MTRPSMGGGPEAIQGKTEIRGRLPACAQDSAVTLQLDNAEMRQGEAGMRSASLRKRPREE